MKPAQRRSQPSQKRIFGALACLLFPAIAILSFLPRRQKRLLHTRGHYHSLAHLAVFGILGFFAARAARSLRARLMLFFVSILFGIGIEFGEHILFRSAMEWKDVVVDAAGVIGGTLIAMLSLRGDEAEDLPGAS